MNNQWPKQSQCLKFVREPESPGWASEHLVPVATPFRCIWTTYRSIRSR
jgi:hypothetical protein